MDEIPNLNFVTPVYLANEGGFRHLGSAVLVRSTESYWLVTAAHVAADGEVGTVLLPRATGGFFPLAGSAVCTCRELTRAAAVKDVADLFCVPLNDYEAGWLSSTGVGFIHLHPGTVDLTGPIPEDSFGVAWGFPTPSIHIAGGHATIAPAFFHDLKFAGAQRLRKAGFDPELNVALIAPRKFARNGVVQHDFALQGLSGGAILRSDPDGRRLIAIATEFRKSASLIIGTRIGHLFASIAHHLELGLPMLKPFTSPVVHPTVLSIEEAVVRSGADRNRAA